MKALTLHENKWIVRAVGVAGHYGVKHGLTKQHTETLFRLLLSLADATEFHTRRGIGWAAKTIAKFHPNIIEQHKRQIESNGVGAWFRKKVEIGLSRKDKYAQRYTS